MWEKNGGKIVLNLVKMLIIFKVQINILFPIKAVKDDISFVNFFFFYNLNCFI